MVAPTPHRPEPPRPVVAVSMGDPGGIGPEVLIKALRDRARRASARFVVLGSSGPMLGAAESIGVEPYWWRIPHDSGLLDSAGAHDVVLMDVDDAPDEGARPPRPTRRGGELSFQYVEQAITLARQGQADAIVTAPISKAAWALAGRGKYPGHTELLATRFGVKRCAMMFDAPSLRVVLVTAHLPLMDVRNALTIGRVHETIDLGAEACRRLGVPSPRIAVCGLNPHAGEGGLLGDEEARLIEPAIRLARDQGLDVSGPFPPDTIFGAALKGRYDLVVAMYHDQGLIPVKLVAFDSAVNLTLGLPTPRTSPDHGTAFDIAGKGMADESSMASAIDLAVRLATPVPAK